MLLAIRTLFCDPQVNEKAGVYLLLGNPITNVELGVAVSKLSHVNALNNAVIYTYYLCLVLHIENILHLILL